MPLLYGEGLWRPFQQLQQEILNNSNDESIFAWGSDFRFRKVTRMLAMYPGDFRSSGNTVPHPFDRDRTENTLRNRGLKFETDLIMSARVGPKPRHCSP
jgi:hypothetical protein